MREGWEVKDLGNVCDILDNKRKPITKKDRIEGDIPYYGATGVLSYVKDYIFDEQLVLLGEDGAKWESGDNSAFLIEGKTWVNNHAHVLRPNREVLDDNWL
ncbi:restriction endonuclease subunit S, partial [Crocinitomix catalasitica]|nr:restriction endonuclease subunit S [Crocinitomix catalasitica]